MLQKATKHMKTLKDRFATFLKSAVLVGGVAVALTACSTTPEVNVTPDAGLPGITTLTPMNPQQNDALAGMMEAAKVELKGHLYRISPHALGIKNPEGMTPLALKLAQYAQDVVAQKTATGQFVLSDDLYLDPTVQPQVWVNYGRWQYGVWINFNFSAQEARNVVLATTVITNTFTYWSGLPYSQVLNLVSNLVKWSFSWCNRYGTGVVVDAGTYGIAPYAYCRAR